MNKALFTASCGKMNETQPQPQENIEQLIMGVRNGDLDATALLMLRVHKQVISVAFDVLQDEALAKESARETLINAISQLKRGVHTGAFEPWLMWLTRSDALLYTQYMQPPKAAAVKPEAPHKIEEKTAAMPAGVYADQKTEKSQFEYSAPSSGIPQATQNENTASNHTAQSPAFWGSRKMAYSEAGAGERRAMRPKTTVLTVCLSLLCLALLWAVFGLIAKNTGGSLPDFGYSWFNNCLFPLF